MYDENDTLAIGQLKKFARLYLARKKIRAKEKQLTAEIQDMQTNLIDHLLDHGIARLPLKGGRTIYMKTTYYPKFKDESYTKQDVIQALKADGITELVQDDYNAKRFSSYLTELVKQNKELPKNLNEIIESSPVTNLAVTGD
jgi:hypothetical protein